MNTTDARPREFPTMRLTSAVAAAAMIASAVAIWQAAQLESSAMIDFIALGITVTGMAVGGAAWAAWSVKRRVRTTAARSLSALASVGVAVAVAAATLFAWAYMDHHGQYARNYGGAGACLSETPYASERAQLAESPSISGDRMKVVPQGGGENRALLFDGTKDGLIPADSHTREVLSRYAC
ncbi:hypothetical protein QQM39_27735 [Streptomyces sp. DT2A-34]|uniref:hypothetical protein n=1 Tax=Streptomyces sp. DT2A-34 TaxID=3051182 RepID=UPI00265C5D9A|nr:hypothetical protein [Streptomyces sp. DT2A-34]MDO0914486.1 hypothetical protein [Streptomyces sp. DT2A-34]